MSHTDQLPPEALSALADGEADADTAAVAAGRWRDDAAVRARWHRYQLIGDVLRSDELGGRGCDADFLQRLRLRLESEPVVLAPSPARRTPAAPRRAGALRRWATPAAVAAGFLAVAGALTVTRLPSAPAVPQLVQAPAAEPVPIVAAASAVAPTALVSVAPERAEPATGLLIRDARIDQYLAAHKQFGGSSALGVPSGFLRSATYELPGAGAAGSR